MATTYLDKQTNKWKLKIELGGRDKRIPLRKATDDEVLDWLRGIHDKPADLDYIVEYLGFGDTRPEPTFNVEGDEVTDDLLGYLDWFEQDYGKHHRPRSVAIMAGILKNFRKFLGGHTMKVDEVSPTTIDAFFDWRIKQLDPRLKKPVKPTTIINDLTLFSGVFSIAIDKGKIKGNPVKPVVKKLRKAYPRPETTKYLDPDERRRLLTALEDAEIDGRIPARYADLTRVMLATGLRVSAAINLEWCWIDNNWIVTVPPQSDKAKTGYSTVVADIGREVLTRLRNGATTGKVFSNVTSNGLLFQLAKFGTFPHALRHSFATALVDLDIPIQTIGSLLGHHSLTTTQRYAKVRDEAKLNAVGKLKLAL